MATMVTLPDFQESLTNAGGAGARTALELPEPRLDAALDSAEGEVVAELSRNYTLPALAVGTLRDIIFSIAAYVATLEYYGSQPLEDRDPVVLRYQRALGLLRRAAKGQIEVEGLVDKSNGSVSGEPAIYQSGPAVNLTQEAQPPTYWSSTPHPGGSW